jgi:hypothetical protein
MDEADAMGQLAVRLLLGALALTGPWLAGCGSATPVDMYFGTDAGADFVAPPREAGADAAADAEDAVDGGVD